MHFLAITHFKKLSILTRIHSLVNRDFIYLENMLLRTLFSFGNCPFLRRFQNNLDLSYFSFWKKAKGK